MAGPYLIGIDGGTQSSKVVVFDTKGNVVSEGRQALRPMLRPAHGVAVHPDDDLWDSIAAACRQALAGFTGDPSEIVAAGLCTIRCCKAFLRADGSLVEPVLSWMDDRAYQAYLPDDASLAYATTSSGYLAHRFTGRFSDAAANNILLQWPIDTDTWQWSDDDVLVQEFNLTREMLLELQLPGEVIGPLTAEAAAATGLPAGIPVVTTANDKAVETLGAGSLGETTALISLGTYIGGILPGRVNHKSARRVLDELRLRPPPLPLREPRHPPRDVDADLVPGSPRPRVRRARRLARGVARGADRAGGGARARGKRRA